MEEKLVLFEKVGQIAIISLNRPKAINAITAEMIDELKAAVDRVAQDKDIKVAVLFGRGEKGFCAGYDLNVSSGMKYDLMDRLARYKFENDLYLKIWDCPKPIIGAIHGHVIGGGTALAFACDMLIAADDTKFGNAEVGYGLNYSVVFPIDVYKIPQNKVREFALTGPESIDIKSAEAYGFVNKVVPLEDLEAETLKMALKVTHLNSNGLQMSKKTLNHVYELMGFKSAVEFSQNAMGLTRLNGADEVSEKFWDIAAEKGFKEGIKWTRARQAEEDKPVLEYIENLKK